MKLVNKYNNIIIKYIHVILSIYLSLCWFVGLLVGNFKKFSTVFFLFSFSSIVGGVGDFYFYSISPPFYPPEGERKRCLSALFRWPWPDSNLPEAQYSTPYPMHPQDKAKQRILHEFITAHSRRRNVSLRTK